jgi:hypothetical protein
LNIADEKTILISFITGGCLYGAFIFLLLFLFTRPTLYFFYTASTCCSTVSTTSTPSSTVNNGADSGSWLKKYLKQLEDKLLDIAPQGGASSSSANSGGEAEPTATPPRETADEDSGTTGV